MASTFPDTPATLLARIAAEATGRTTDEAAWLRLFGLYSPAIRKFAECQGASADEAEDVAQDIFAKLVQTLRTGGYSATAGRFRCFLGTMIRNALVSRWRKAQVRVTCVPIDRIPEDDLPYVFDRFYKSDKSRGLDKTGVGLGLYIARTIIEAHNEAIWVESVHGEWCKFTFTLPKGTAPKNVILPDKLRDDSGGII